MCLANKKVYQVRLVFILIPYGRHRHNPLLHWQLPLKTQTPLAELTRLYHEAIDPLSDIRST